MLKRGKCATLHALKRLGIYSVAGGSAWRRGRLLILCYHGISLDDEHEWNPSLYMPQRLLRTRLQAIRDSGCDVVLLEEGLRRLAEGMLERPTVVLTFDDGTYDFYARAYPVLGEYGMPATVYLTTYYCADNRPVFTVYCAYLLWKARGRRIPARPLTGETKEYNLDTTEAIAAATREIVRFAEERHLSADEKNCLAAALAREAGVDADDLNARRVLHIMTPAEVAEISAGGIDVQLHTHRHRSPLDRELFAREIQDNRTFIEKITAKPARHFCYPSGVYCSEFTGWLNDLDVLSATTCEPGFASHHSDPLILPRLVDTCSLTDIEFEGWLTGAAAFLPRRTGYGRIKAS